MNIREFVEQSVRKEPQKTYLYFQDSEITYCHFNNNINKLANGFLRLGVSEGDRVCLMLPNSPEFLYSWFALSKIGAIMVPVNLAFREREVSYIVNHSEAKIFVCGADQLPIVTEIAKNCSSLKHIIFAGEERTPGLINIHELLEDNSEDLRWIDVDDEQPAAYVYTSGTTGWPKGVMLSHKTYVLTGQSYAFTVGISPQDRLMTPNPLFHINAQLYSTMGTLAANASLILLERFSASRVWEQTRRYQPNKLVLLLPTASILFVRPEAEAGTDNPVEKVIAGGAPKGHFRDFEKRFGVTLQTIYSLTESPIAIMSPLNEMSKDGGIGVPMRHPNPEFRNESKIVDQEGHELPPKARGEIIIKNPVIMKGYYKDPELTAEKFKDGWLYTGDSGYRDEEGYFFFAGRMGDVIRRKGELISAVEVEDVINSHSEVSYSAVIGVPSIVGDEEVKAYVVLKSQESLPYDKLVQWCADRLAYFKVPRYIEYRDELTRNAVGRVVKSALKEEKEDLTQGCYDREAKK